ncbi:MAG: hypothetical protein R6U20_01875 [Longimonas sp.]|uniref:hypothetical protein n=1 Tax=Longimonas sp. TaxID=2039626 RepID=UPI003975F390
MPNTTHPNDLLNPQEQRRYQSCSHCVKASGATPRPDFDIERRRAFGVDATQAPPDLSGEADGYSRVDFYLEQIIDLYETLTELGVSYWVRDGFYAKQKVFDAVTGLGGDLITRLRSDANLRYLCTGP